MVCPRHTVGEDKNAALGIVLKASFVCKLHSIASGKPGRGAVGKFDDELLTDEAGGPGKTGVLLLLQLILALVLILRLRVGVVVTVDYARNAEATVLKLLGEACSLDGLGVECIDAIVVGVECLDEVGVNLLVQNVQVSSGLEICHRGDDILAEVHVNETSRRKLSGVTGESGVELALMVVEVARVFIVYSADIDDSVAGLEDFGVAGAHERGVGVGREQTQHGDSKGLIGVEVTAVQSFSIMGVSIRQIECYLWVPINGLSILSFLAGFSLAMERVRGSRREGEEGANWGKRKVRGEQAGFTTRRRAVLKADIRRLQD